MPAKRKQAPKSTPAGFKRPKQKAQPQHATVHAVDVGWGACVLDPIGLA